MDKNHAHIFDQIYNNNNGYNYNSYNNRYNNDKICFLGCWRCATGYKTATYAHPHYAID